MPSSSAVTLVEVFRVFLAIVGIAMIDVSTLPDETYWMLVCMFNAKQEIQIALPTKDELQAASKAASEQKNDEESITIISNRDAAGSDQQRISHKEFATHVQDTFAFLWSIGEAKFNENKGTRQLVQQLLRHLFLHDTYKNCDKTIRKTVLLKQLSEENSRKLNEDMKDLQPVYLLTALRLEYKLKDLKTPFLGIQDGKLKLVEKPYPLLFTKSGRLVGYPHVHIIVEPYHDIDGTVHCMYYVEVQQGGDPYLISINPTKCQGKISGVSGNIGKRTYKPGKNIKQLYERWYLNPDPEKLDPSVFLIPLKARRQRKRKPTGALVDQPLHGAAAEGAELPLALLQHDAPLDGAAPEAAQLPHQDATQGTVLKDAVDPPEFQNDNEMYQFLRENYSKEQRLSNLKALLQKPNDMGYECPNRSEGCRCTLPHKPSECAFHWEGLISKYTNVWCNCPHCKGDCDPEERLCCQIPEDPEEETGDTDDGNTNEDAEDPEDPEDETGDTDDEKPQCKHCCGENGCEYCLTCYLVYGHGTVCSNPDSLEKFTNLPDEWDIVDSDED